MRSGSRALSTRGTNLIKSYPAPGGGGGGGRGGTLIFSYIGRLGSFFFLGGGGQNFEFQYFLGFSEK